jgi:hypothetical protein|tara:strand:- start:1026 stop:1460 length:435 start_codon:yes stop_codon:yes gene_type:complete
MAQRVTHFLHSSSVTGAQVLGAAFGIGHVHVHSMTANAPPFQQAQPFHGMGGGVTVTLTGDATPATLTVRICADAAGDVVLVPDTTADLVAGITTATQKCATFSLQTFPLFNTESGLGEGNLYLFAYVDAGTPTFAKSVIAWWE